MPAIFVSIAVSKPNDLTPLPGALTAAQRMADWAEDHGYISVHVDDRDGAAVTVERLRHKISEAIKNVTDEHELTRIVIFFAGHGASLSVGDHYWILTNWNKRPSEAIKVSMLQRALEYYGPVQVTIIGDACQEFSARFMQITGDSILDIPDEDPRPYELDQFFAVDVGQQAFMIKGAEQDEDFCIFTEVLLDALEGDVEMDWYERMGERHAVTSQSLARFLVNRVEREASRYGLKMSPRPRPGFYTDRVYAHAPTAAPVSSTPVVEEFYEANAEIGRPVAASMERIDPENSMAAEVELHEAFESHDGGAFGTAEEDDAEVGEFNVPAAASMEPRAAAHSKDLDFELPFEIDVGIDAEAVPASVLKNVGIGSIAVSVASPRPRRIQKPRFDEASSPKSAETNWSTDAESGRVARRLDFESKLRVHAKANEEFSPECGISVTGAEVTSVVVSRGQLTRESSNRFALEVKSDGEICGVSDALVTLSNGRHFSVCCVQGFVSELQVLDESTFSVRHRPRHVTSYDLDGAIDVLAQAHAGLLSSSEVVNAANLIRWEKHRILTLGCIAGQFYDLIRDVDSLRSMASFYATNKQPIPLDIVLYGGGTISEEAGTLFARVPAVEERAPRTEEEQRQRFTWHSTPEVARHPIAGRVPWMRHAWGAIATARYDQSAVGWKAQALRAMEDLAPGIFTNFDKGREAAAELAGISLQRPG